MASVSKTSRKNRVYLKDHSWIGQEYARVSTSHATEESLLIVSRASVIEYINQENRTNSQPTPIAYFYCARNTAEPERADPDEILRSILEQLSSSDADLPIRDPVVNAYKEKKNESKGRKPQKLTLDEAVDVILALLETNPAIIVIDALDECDSARRQLLFLALQKIIRRSANLVKVFVSSRDDHDIVHRLSNSPNLYINSNDNGKDIERFVHSQLDQRIKDEMLLCGVVSQSLKDHIIETLIAKAKGMLVSSVYFTCAHC